MTPPAIRVALADDHTLFRRALSQLLDAHGDIEIVGTAGDGRGAIELVRASRPDVLLLDVDMPGPGVTDTVQVIRSRYPSVQILMLSMYDSPSTIRALLALGVRGYLLKSSSDAELLAALRQITRDQDHVVLSVTAKALFAAPEPAVTVSLTPRELEILHLVAGALSNAQIGNRLRLTEATVKRHLHNAFVKLDAVSRLDAVNKAVAAGLLPAPTRDPGPGD
ncbi:MAG TPA: response regulator transcription factor [Jatrophihabitans sp.]|nr:response regulator transcription factor [Jatrophihabitans sp.]